MLFLRLASLAIVVYFIDLALCTRVDTADLHVDLLLSELQKCLTP